MKLDLIPRAQLSPDWFQGFQVRGHPYLIIQRKCTNTDAMMLHLLGNREWVVLHDRRPSCEPVELVVGHTPIRMFEHKVRQIPIRIISSRVGHARSRLVEYLNEQRRNHAARAEPGIA